MQLRLEKRALEEALVRKDTAYKALLNSIVKEES